MNNAIRCNEGILSTSDNLVLFFLSYALHSVGVKQRKVEVIFLIVTHRWIEHWVVPKGSLNSSHYSSAPPLRHPGSCRGAHFPPIVSQLESTICFAYKSTVRMEMTN